VWRRSRHTAGRKEFVEGEALHTSRLWRSPTFLLLWLDNAAPLAYNAASVSAQERSYMYIHKPMTDLKFNVAQLLREETGGRRSYEFSEESLPLDEETTLDQIVGSVRFTRTASGVLVDVSARGAVEMLCMRCLNPATTQIKLHFRDEFHSKIEVNTGMPLPEPDEEDPFFINENHLVDLGEAIREYALLELPMQPLCKPDCKGICPTCGADLNTGLCNCRSDDSDERFAALKALLEE
jgi:DUF177 domain-containing protein